MAGSKRAEEVFRQKHCTIYTGCVPPTFRPFSHPIVYMACRAESEIRRVTLFRYCHRELLEFCQKYRGNKFSWSPRLRSTADKRNLIQKWMLSTPSMLEWFFSADAYHAPRTYPAFLREAFGKVPPPRPYELASLNRGAIPKRSYYAKGIFYVRAYCFGMTIPQLGRITGEPVGFIKDEMIEAMTELVKDPRFQLWCLNIDWNKITWPISLDVGMLAKLEAQHGLSKGPHTLPYHVVKLLVDSPVFWNFALSGKMPKRGRLRQGLNRQWLGSHTHRRKPCQSVKFHGRQARIVRDPREKGQSTGVGLPLSLPSSGKT